MGLGSRTARGDNWTSLVFSPGRVDVAVVARPEGRKPAVLAWDSFAVPEGGELEALRRLRARMSGPCTTLLRYRQYRLLQIDAPTVPEQEMRDAVRWRVKEMVDFPIEQAGIDVLPIPGVTGSVGRTPQTYVVAADRAILGTQVRLFQEAKVPLVAIDIPELAQRNVAGLFEAKNRGLALLAFDDDGGRLTFSYNGELYATRHIEVTRNDLVAAAKDASAGLTDNLYERVLLDVQRSLDNFDRNFGAIALSRLLLVPGPGIAAFAEYLKSNLYQPVEVMDLRAAIDCDAVPALADANHQAAAFLAIGAALRQEAPA